MCIYLCLVHSYLASVCVHCCPQTGLPSNLVDNCRDISSAKITVKSVAVAFIYFRPQALVKVDSIFRNSLVASNFVTS